MSQEVKRVPQTPILLPNLYTESGDINREAIARFRKLHGLSAEDMGELLGVTPRTIVNWEAGRSTPNPMNEERLYLFLQATARMIEDNNGFLPPTLRLKKGLKQYLDMSAEDVPPIIQYFQVHEDSIANLKAEVDSLRSHIEEMQTQHRNEKTELIMKLRDELRHIRDEVDASLARLV